MTRYRVPVSDPILVERDYWKTITGFRLVSVDGPWPGHPDVTICTFDDDDAPAGLEGRLVEPVFQRDGGLVRITARNVIAGGPPDQPLWTILIATLASRRDKLARLLAHLLPQCETDGRVEVLGFWDNGERPVAVKRQALLMSAAGRYVSFVDDDDTVDPRFVAEVALAMTADPDYVAFEHAYYVSGVRQPQRVMTGLHHKTWFSTAEVLARDITHINPVRTSIAQHADFTAEGEGAEDWIYTTVVRRLAETEAEAAPGRALYHYFHDPADSAQHELAPHLGYPRLDVTSSCFRWIDEETR
jgi:hypothetical protein